MMTKIAPVNSKVDNGAKIQLSLIWKSVKTFITMHAKYLKSRFSTLVQLLAALFVLCVNSDE